MGVPSVDQWGCLLWTNGGAFCGPLGMTNGGAFCGPLGMTNGGAFCGPMGHGKHIVIEDNNILLL